MSQFLRWLVDAGFAGLLRFRWFARQIFTSFNYKEITWQKFCKDFLANQTVYSLIVVNKVWVKVVLKENYAFRYPCTFWFGIGSVDLFERQLNDEISSGFGSSSVPFTEKKVRWCCEVAFVFAILYAAKCTFESVQKWFSQRRNNKITQQSIGVTFRDVAGCDDSKTEIMEFVDCLKNSQTYSKLGAKIPKGALLTGPPGTGKTLLAKAAAGETNVPFIAASGSEFVKSWVGTGPAYVKQLFAKARDIAPCILFIDEIDSVGKKRTSGRSGESREWDNTLNQLLVEMDGFETSKSCVVILAATNRIDVLDEALLRPGRFDRRIYLSLPDVKSRASIFQVHLRPVNTFYSKTHLSQELAVLTPGFSGADIANVCNEAALLAARNQAEQITKNHFIKAIERVVAGIESKGRVLEKDEKEVVAFHEAGHAVVSWFLEHADPVIKVSITPRGQSAGHTQFLPKERTLYNSEQIMDKMCVALGGRAAEERFFHQVTTGGQDDLQKVTQTAYTQITQYGMSNKIGPLSFESTGQRKYSDATAQMIDGEVRNLVEKAMNRTKTLINKHKEQVKKVAQLLIDRETIDSNDMVTVIGSRPLFGIQEI